MNIANLLTRTAYTFPDLPALAHGMDITATYREFADQSAALAGALVNELSLEKGDRVALIMKNHPEYWVALFASWQAGLVAVPVNAKLHLKEFRYIIEHSGARLCFATLELARELKNLSNIVKVIDTSDPDYSKLKTHSPVPAAEVTPDDLAWLFYTSGTTGKPKGAMLSHRNLLCCTMSYFADVTHINPGDAAIHSAPQTHGSGLYGLPLIAKGGIQVTPKSGGFDPAETLDLIAHYPNSCFFFAPTMVHRLINSEAFSGADTRNLKLIVYGGGPMYEADIRKALDAIGPKFCQIYGQGEAPMTITALSQWELTHNSNHPRRSERLASVGTARTDVEIRIVDQTGKPSPAGEVGEITLRGDVLMLGYWQNEDATRDTIRDGWLYTGDMGYFDNDGFLTLKDRSKDVIISGGTNIYPREIEEVLLTHPAVDEISVIGRYHPDWGEEVVAFVVLSSKTEPDTTELDAHCLKHLARFKRPKAYFFVEALPKNNNGKVLKTELRELVK
ncbi:MAG: long-chain fatty acid--CoA ligase [Deltaproteobacteria bacterium]|nr:long-chain fatty acid--CoA ligase [Deltaproteobacteria bacterium]MBT4266432.1 long-chain fatty acid--CoA ligase [Deltaproteobacteria bacterium]MBT4640367.1 long-chain fatty acid--CoA ligase [Deltaproteobacteria bacterium]MBT6500708.1 long-chain fatty acid--CoA ligase [Deltaproteobacteria bacterium]MBT7155214.1 long-chain fatty acid--CoA ligase [Deltaproteobacteria bacterium]